MLGFILSFFLIFSVLVTGCSGPSIPLGHFEGQMESRKTELPGYPSPELISLDISKEKSGTFSIQIQDIHHKHDLVVKIKKKSSNSFTFEAPGLGEMIFKPTQYLAETPLGQLKCYKSDQKHLIDLCADPTEIKIIIKDQDQNLLLSITAGRFNRQAAFELEASKSFTLKEVLTRALSMNFASKIEYKKMMQAQDQVSASYLNLLPKVRFFSTVSLVGFVLTLNPFSLMYALGDIAPFLFPTQWLNARDAQHQARIAQDGLKIMQANLAFQVQSQAYKVALYHEQSEIIEKELRTLQTISDYFSQLNQQGRIDRYWQYHLDSFKYKIENERSILESHLRAVLQSLAGTLGFLNPNALSDLSFSPDDLLSFSHNPIDPLLIGRLTQSRSLEIRQMRNMQKAVRLEKISMGFQWLDPGGNPSLGLGFNLIPQMRMSDRKYAILMDQEHERLTDSYQAGVKAAEQYNGLILGYQRAAEYRNEQNHRLAQILIDLQLLSNSRETITPRSEIRSLEVISALQDHLAAELLIPDLTTQQRVAQSKLERLLLIGYLSILHPMKKPYTLSDLHLEAQPQQSLPIQ